ncbi:MAG: hypothetical protein ACFFD1_02280, partial [Candidatus Thorarchaeota archaeon]
MPEFVKSFVGHQRKVTEIIPHPKITNSFLSSSTDKTIRQWDALKETSIILYSTKNEIKSIKAINDNLYILEDRSLKELDFTTNKDKTIFKNQSNLLSFDVYYSNAFQTTYIAIGTIEGEVYLLKDGKMEKNTVLSIDGSPITSLKFKNVIKSPKLAVGTLLGTINIYEGANFYFLVNNFATQIGEIRCIVWGKNEDMNLFVGNNSGVIQEWQIGTETDTNKNKVMKKKQVQAHLNAITAILYDNNENIPILWTASMDETIKAWNWSADIISILQLKPTNYPITSIMLLELQYKEQKKSYTFFTRKLLAGSNDYTIRMWEVGILNFFPVIWGLRQAIIEQWETWKKSIINTDFPKSYDQFLQKNDEHINLMIQERDKIIFTKIKQILDFQWRSILKEFQNMLSNSSIKTFDEESEIKKLTRQYERQIESMSEKIRDYLNDLLLTDYNTFLLKKSSFFLNEFINTFENKLKELIKNMLLLPNIKKSVNLPFYPDWFFDEVMYLL